MQAKHKPRYNVIDVPMEQTNMGREISGCNSAIQTTMRKNNRATVMWYGIPDTAEPLYSRRIDLIRVSHDELGDGDHPDLNDLYETDLPWTGLVTFQGASRQFRNANGMMASVHVVREYNGFLYRMAAGIVPPHATHVVRHTAHTQLRNYAQYELVDDWTLVYPELIPEFQAASHPPKSMMEHLGSLGYEWKEDRFVHPQRDGLLDQIYVTLYGKILKRQ